MADGRDPTTVEMSTPRTDDSAPLVPRIRHLDRVMSGELTGGASLVEFQADLAHALHEMDCAMTRLFPDAATALFVITSWLGHFIGCPHGPFGDTNARTTFQATIHAFMMSYQAARDGVAACNRLSVANVTESPVGPKAEA
jgi:hypothetical protein